MYGLSKERDLSFLLGSELLQVCIGRNEVILNFTADIAITVMSAFSVRNLESVRDFDEPMAGALEWVQLLHDTVVEASATDGGGLELRFASGRSVTLLDDSPQFESFWIRFSGGEIIV